MPAHHHSVFLQAGCPSCRPTNSAKALKAHQPAGDVNHKPGGRLPLLSATPAVTPSILLLGEQRHNGREQFA